MDKLYSVIIPTRNRPEQFNVALDSVLKQTEPDIEIIAVNDGSDDSALLKYKNIEEKYSGQVKFIYLMQTTTGHGHCFVRNQGVTNSSGKYVVFLDDDDEWICKDFLKNASQDMNEFGDFDLYMANQYAVDSYGNKKDDIWLSKLSISNNFKSQNSTQKVELSELLQIDGFCHMNCLIIKKTLYQQIGGMDECLRYEPDRDLYNRAIDSAQLILYNPSFVSKHNIPDKKKADNASTKTSILEKKLFQLRTADKAILFSKNRSIRNKALVAKSYYYQSIADELYKNKEYDSASHFALLALASGKSFRWLIFTCYVFFLKVLNGIFSKK